MIRTQERPPVPVEPLAGRPADRVDIRRAGGGDCGALAKFLTGLSLRTRYLRFFAGFTPDSPSMLRILTGGQGEVTAVVATEQDAIIGHAMAAYVDDPDPLAHIGVVVADEWQGRGVGSALMRALAAAIRDRGTGTMLMEVLPENQRVLTMIADRWPAARYDRSGEYVTITTAVS